MCAARARCRSPPCRGRAPWRAAGSDQQLPVAQSRPTGARDLARGGVEPDGALAEQEFDVMLGVPLLGLEAQRVFVELAGEELL
jgi:hypothetical protein